MCNEENTGVIALFDGPRKSDAKCVASELLTDLDDSNDFVFTFGTKINKSDDKEAFANYKPILEDYFKSLASQKDISFPAVLEKLSNEDIENTVAEETEGIKLDKPVEGTVID